MKTGSVRALGLGASLLALAHLLPMGSAAINSGHGEPVAAKPGHVVLPVATPRISLRGRLKDARVTLGKRPCDRWTGTRWQCGPEPWKWVGPYQGKATADGRTRYRECIWAHPESGSPLKITFDEVPAGRFVYGEATLLDVPHEGAAVEVRVIQGTRRLASVRLTDKGGKRRWKPWRATVKRDSSDPLTFEITTPKDSWRHVCFTAFVGEVVP
ncbi:MAG: hypothetical protein ACI9OJ_001143 [Myxococcota bacterium]|jgi:hypothetical protein